MGKLSLCFLYQLPISVLSSKVFFKHICWIYKSGPEKILDKNDVSEKQKTDDFFVRGRGCKSEAVLRK